MGWGLADKKAVASAKLSSMEKYGFTYQEDLYLVEDCMSSEVSIKRNEDGTVNIEWGNHSFSVKIRDFVPKKNLPKKEAVSKGDKERQDKWVSIWDVENH